MIAYFPPPYEDELLYSWLARYYSKSGYMAYTLAAEELFTDKHIKPSIEFISKLTSTTIAAIEQYATGATDRKAYDVSILREISEQGTAL